MNTYNIYIRATNVTNKTVLQKSDIVHISEKNNRRKAEANYVNEHLFSEYARALVKMQLL